MLNGWLGGNEKMRSLLRFHPLGLWIHWCLDLHTSGLMPSISNIWMSFVTGERFRHRYIRMRGWNIEKIGYQSILLYQNYWGTYKDTLFILKPLNCPILDWATGAEKLCFLFCVAAALLSLIVRVTVPCPQVKHWSANFTSDVLPADFRQSLSWDRGWVLVQSSYVRKQQFDIHV